MTLQLTKFSDVGRALTVAEVDANWTDIETILNAAMNAEDGGVTITGVAPTEDGSGIKFLGSDGSTLATVALPTPFTPLGAWESGMDYSLRHVVTYDNSAWICMSPHTAGDSFETDAGLGKWIILAEGVSNDAENVAFDNEASGMDAETVQDAIEELHAALEAIPDPSDDITDLKSRVEALETAVAAWADTDDQTAAEVSFEAPEGMTSETVQDALEELKSAVDAIVPGDTDTDDQTAAEVSYDNTASELESDTVQEAIDELKASLDALPTGGGSSTERTEYVYIDLFSADGAVTETQWAEAAIIEVNLPDAASTPRSLALPASALGIRRFVIVSNGGSNTVTLTGAGSLELPAGDANYDIFATASAFMDVSC